MSIIIQFLIFGLILLFCFWFYYYADFTPKENNYETLSEDKIFRKKKDEEQLLGSFLSNLFNFSL